MTTQHRMCLMGMLVLFCGILAVGERDSSAQASTRISPESIYIDAGVPLGSLFVGISPSKQADYLLNPAEKLTRNDCQDDGSIPVIGAIAKWLDIEPVSASGCEQSDECGGHYMVSSYRSCGYSCNEREEFYYSHPIYDWNYENGWWYTDEDSCCGYSCAEDGCENWN